MEQLYAALTKPTAGKPIAIILDTVKGKASGRWKKTAGNHSMTVGAEVFDRWLDSLRADLAALEA